jgi:cysteine synthase A
MWPTPILKVDERAWAKLEFFNPISHSVKDRTALYLVLSAIKEGKKGIVETTSGNTGLAMAALTAVLNLKFTVFLPKVASQNYRVLLEIFGAEVREGRSTTTETLELVKEFEKAKGYYHPDQFHNELNVKVHMETTAKEIEEQMSSIGVKVERVIASMGTGGHAVGIGKYFKDKYGKDVEVIGVVPAKGSRIPGIKRQDEGNPFELRHHVIDKVVDVTALEAYEGVKKVARKAGILVGLSSGAVYAAYEKVKDGRATVLIFPDDGFRYAEEFELLDEALKQVRGQKE